MHSFEDHANWVSLSGSRRTPNGHSPKRQLHRIAEVMEQEQVGFRSASRQMKMTATQLRAEADATYDLRLSDLFRWQTALKVPIADLIREPDRDLSPMIKIRSGLVKAMRTLRTIQDQLLGEPTHVLSIQLGQQLMELMPELSHVSAWPSVGQRRTSDELGAVVDRKLSDDFFDQSADY